MGCLVSSPKVWYILAHLGLVPVQLCEKLTWKIFVCFFLFNRFCQKHHVDQNVWEWSVSASRSRKQHQMALENVTWYSIQMECHSAPYWDLSTLNKNSEGNKKMFYFISELAYTDRGTVPSYAYCPLFLIIQYMGDMLQILFQQCNQEACLPCAALSI